MKLMLTMSQWLPIPWQVLVLCLLAVAGLLLPGKAGKGWLMLPCAGAAAAVGLIANADLLLLAAVLLLTMAMGIFLMERSGEK